MLWSSVDMEELATTWITSRRLKGCQGCPKRTSTTGRTRSKSFLRPAPVWLITV
ncbi:14-alpha-glucan-branching enzyme 2-2 chloroplastic/amyloplastic [Zea mays]|uniref:14-alpha-glucan-branching enzyme 2-2 chloroplastic/amyloplastic n=1 Tax=Zea mays TaxID=4577 RepID=A0A1D6GWP3_MAIZE|nr:14-alpha-glucan-branching enzyme 2-2 chloroplastic/amyloplastic [Zea mays]